VSYSIDEGLEDAEKRLVALREVLKRYPDAHLSALPGGEEVWVSDDVVPDRIRVSVDGPSRRVYFCPFEDVSGIDVFKDHWGWIPVHAIEKDRKLVELILKVKA
jgi:hypothetical protein